MNRQLIVFLILSIILLTGCQGTTPPGWDSPVAELLLDENAFPKGWQIDFEQPERQMIDSTVNHVSREWWNPDKGSANISQSIWRAFTIRDAKRKYSELRENPLLLVQFTPSPDDFYIEFQTPPELSFQSQVADDFYVACGWVVWAYCEVVARYKNYTIYLNLPLEAINQNQARQGLTYVEIDLVIQAVDNKFHRFIISLP